MIWEFQRPPTCKDPTNCSSLQPRQFHEASLAFLPTDLLQPVHSCPPQVPSWSFRPKVEGQAESNEGDGSWDGSGSFSQSAGGMFFPNFPIFLLWKADVMGLRKLSKLDHGHLQTRHHAWHAMRQTFKSSSCQLLPSKNH